MDTTNLQFKITSTKVFYLRMNEPRPLRAAGKAEMNFEELQKPIDPEHYLYYYRLVGLTHNWLDRLIMSPADLSTLVNADNVHIYVLTISGRTAGFVELVKDKKFVELLYFGLAPEFVGKGYGKTFLDWSIAKAWSFNPDWVQLNTCELDHPNALPTYTKLGFQQYKTTFEERKVSLK